MVEREKQREDTGFGTNTVSTSARLVNQEGNFNVKKSGPWFEVRMIIFHRMITMSWVKFYAVVFVFYFFVNLFFGLIYYAIGIEYLF